MWLELLVCTLSIVNAFTNGLRKKQPAQFANLELTSYDAGLPHSLIFFIQTLNY